MNIERTSKYYLEVFMNTQQIREASNKIWNAGPKLTHNQIDEILTDLVATATQQAVELERKRQDVIYAVTHIGFLAKYDREILDLALEQLPMPMRQEFFRKMKIIVEALSQKGLDE